MRADSSDLSGGVAGWRIDFSIAPPTAGRVCRRWQVVGGGAVIIAVRQFRETDRMDCLVGELPGLVRLEVGGARNPLVQVLPVSVPSMAEIFRPADCLKVACG